MKYLKLAAYSLERLIGKAQNHKKVLVTEMNGNSYVRRVSRDKLQELITSPRIRAVRFLK